jgi:hypothetical protein
MRRTDVNQSPAQSPFAIRTADPKERTALDRPETAPDFSSSARFLLASQLPAATASFMMNEVATTWYS